MWKKDKTGTLTNESKQEECKATNEKYWFEWELGQGEKKEERNKKKEKKNEFNNYRKRDYQFGRR